MENRQLSTGMRGLDRILGGVLAGDNIVWQVESIDDFLPLVEPYCRYATTQGRRLIYFRFAKHPPLVGEESGAEIHELHPDEGFETFLFTIHRIIGEAGLGAYYLFDCLSDLVADWYSDQMLANFFMLTCPYLFDLETVTYFPILRGRHSSYATAPITDTTQLFLDVYRHRGGRYVRPIKVQHRFSATMYMLHAWKDAEFTPVTESALIAEILSAVPRPELESGGAHLDIWSRTFEEAEELRDEIVEGLIDSAGPPECVDRLLRMAISRDERILALCRHYMSLDDLLAVGKRMIGTGLIGGKSVGMLLARAILRRSSAKWDDLLEMHDSFYVASDVFYTFLVRNGCWWVRESQRNPDVFLKGAQEARRQILRGSFPDFLVRQFSDMLDYFGQSPIIVRSSSLLEDNFGNAFAGKYESVFCANQGPRRQRLEDFMSAVRTIYASSMSEKALKYRARRDLLDRDEQMALLVQRVSGSLHGNLFFPQVAGVGFSFNPFRWNERIDPEAGVLRLVFGLGTRAVDRSDDDYTRVVALNAPELRPEEKVERISQRAQHNVDVLNLSANQLMPLSFREVTEQSPGLDTSLFASRDREIERAAREHGIENVFSKILTFDGLLRDTRFFADVREMLHALQKAYEYPVDIEFTGNFRPDGEYHINLVQCRPLQVQGGGAIADPPESLPENALVLESQDAVIGHSRAIGIDHIIYVVPKQYGLTPVRDRYGVARLIGRIVHSLPEGSSILLVGPGRWGTTTPSLGVPVSFAEINKVAALCEVVAMRDDVVPDVSLGTHFFSELVEMNMLYFALFPDKEGNRLNEALLERQANLLPSILDGLPETLVDTVRVISAASFVDSKRIVLHADAFKQKVVCYGA
jgi:pyruvate,water dikinase